MFSNYTSKIGLLNQTTIIKTKSTLKSAGVNISDREILPSWALAEEIMRPTKKAKIVRMMETCGTAMPVVPKV